ncbi:MAG: RidA family protein [Bacteroidota bacterium]
MTNIRKILTEKAPAPIGPYSQAVLVDGKFLYTAGQGPMDPKSGKLVEGGIKEQTRQVMKNLEAILLAGGASLASVVKTTVFLKDMNEFTAMNEVYAEFLGAAAPARSTIEAARLPRDIRVEIEAVAIVEK